MKVQRVEQDANMPSFDRNTPSSHTASGTAGQQDALRVGIICPYSFETPGGVQNHIRDFARQLRRRGHEVQVFAP